MAPAEYVIGVRALCEFTAKAGDLDLRFTPSPSAEEGVAGHAIVAARRPAGYQSELSLEGEYEGLRVRGRADGYDAAARRLEEIKTHRGPLERLPANHRALHWAQAKVYGWLVCRRDGLAEIELALVYFEIGCQRETSFVETHQAEDLRRFFEMQCGRFLAWSRQELAHAAARDRMLAGLRFPHAELRRGQRALAEAVWRAAGDGRCLVAQAPTGIGKTLGTVFPLLKAWPGQRLDKIFFLTAKGSGRRMALDALRLVLGDGARPQPLRVVELVAREKACEHRDKACHGEACPLARGFYDRLPAARERALDEACLDQAALRRTALEHAVCPYYLGQELVRWADVVVGDYNHYFDLHAILHALTMARQWRVGLLVDEAHNLLERARRMYSAPLDRTSLRAARRAAPAGVARALDRLARRWRALVGDAAVPYRVEASVPEGFATALQQAVAAIAEHLAEQPLSGVSPLLAFHFEALHFLRLLERFGPHTLFDISLAGPHDAAVDATDPPRAADPRAADPSRATDSIRAADPPRPLAKPPAHTAPPRNTRLTLRNIVPAPHLAPRFAAAHASVLFSATLTPMPFHRDTLGLPADAAWLDVESPFAAAQLRVHVARHVSTRWRDRSASLEPIAALLARQYAEAPGNYLAFFGSYDYLRQALAVFARRHPEVPVWEQSPAMTAAAREAFLARFTPESRGIAFAVLGGSFGEAIDLPGRRLIGAFIATLGLPPVNPVNEQIRLRMQSAFGSGWDYTYLYPGIQKVVQAVGRVIRSHTDAGVVHLIDDRYARAEVRRLFPGWWRLAGTSPRMEGSAGSPGSAH
jgi:Rad3-related DNA helicase